MMSKYLPNAQTPIDPLTALIKLYINANTISPLLIYLTNFSISVITVNIHTN